MIQFPDGMGHIGRSVFHIMRELRMRHDLAWEDSLLRDEESNRTLTRQERGVKLNERQKANAIADMAAVLGGLGKGNKMWVPVLDGSEGLVDTSGETRTDNESGSTEGLLRASVFWTSDLDKNFARQWPANVSHSTFAESMFVPLEQVEENVSEEVLSVEEPKKTSWLGR